MMALNNLLLQFNKQLFEIEILKEDRNSYLTPQQQLSERARLSKIENVSLNKLYNIFNSREYEPSLW